LLKIMRIEAAPGWVLTELEDGNIKGKSRISAMIVNSKPKKYALEKGLIKYTGPKQKSFLTLLFFFYKKLQLNTHFFLLLNANRARNRIT
jgi:hypothetical protein